MRLWSLHPKYLDSKGLVALWREGLLAKAVLRGETKGYKKHPQLERFKKHENPLAALDTYLLNVYNESVLRCYKFNRNKIGSEFTNLRINITDGQVEYEFKHLLCKLKFRDQDKYVEFRKLIEPDVNPVFVVVEGDVESWEVIH